MQLLRTFLILFFLAGTSLLADDVKSAQAKKQEEIESILKTYEKELAENPDNINLLKALAEAYYYLHDYKQAAILFQKVVDLDPSNQQAKIFLGLSYLHTKNIAKSRPLLEAALEKDPTNADILFGLGQIEYLHHHFEEANTFYQKALAKDPNHLATLSALGELRLKQKQYSEAQAIFEKIEPLYPQETWVKVSLKRAKIGPVLEEIKILEQKGKIDEAIYRYQQLLVSQPDLLELYLLLGRLYTQTKQYQDAIDLYKIALKRYPKANQLRTALGFTYLAQRDLKKSENILHTSLLVHPEDTEAIAGLGRIAALNGQTKQAEKYFEKALQLEPTNNTALIYFADLKLKSGDYLKAQQLYQKLVKLNPKENWMKFALEQAKYGPVLKQIKLKEKQKEYKSAEKLYQKIIAQKPMSPDLYMGFGNFYMNWKRYQKAIAIYLKGLEVQPESDSLQLALGYAYLSKGDLANSQIAFQKILNKNPNPDALAGLGRIAELQGRLKEAGQLYQKALTIEPDNMTALAYLGHLRMEQKRYKEAETIFAHILRLQPKARWAKQAVEEARQGPLIEAIKQAEAENDVDYLEILYQQVIDRVPDNQVYYLRLGRLYEKTQRSQEAIDVYLKGLEKEPKSPELLIALGFAYLKQNYLNLSYEVFTSALEQDFGNPEALAGLGRIAELEGNIKEAEDLYQQALMNDPHDITSLSYLANLKLHLKQYAAARDYYNTLKQILPKEKWIQNALKETYLGPLLDQIRELENLDGLTKEERLNRELQIEKLYLQLIHKAPIYADYYLGLGQLYASMKRFPEAIQTYQRGLRVNPNADYLYAAMGFSYLYQQNLDQASKEFQIALEINPRNAEAWAGLGHLAELTGNIPEAESYYQTALSFDQNNITALSFLAALKLKQKQYAQAQHIYQELQKLKPKAEWIHQAIKEIEVAPLLVRIAQLQENGEFEQATQVYLQLIDHVSDRADYYLGFGNLYVRMAEYEKAIPIFKQGLEVDPHSDLLHVALGITYLLNKNLDEAKKEFEIAYVHLPNNPDILAGFGRIEALQGHTEKAETFYQQALQVGPYNMSTLSFYGEFLMKEKRFAEAYCIYLRLQKLDPKASWIRRALKSAEDGPMIAWAQALQSLGELREAKAQYLGLLAASPDNADYYFLLGQVYIEMEKIDEAIEIFQRGLDIDPTVKYLWRVLAFAYLSKEEICSAREILVWLVTEDPNDVDSWVGLGRVQALLGHYCLAREYYLHALDIDGENLSALSNLAALEAERQYYFSALDIANTMLNLKPELRWVRRVFYDIWDKTRPYWYLEGRYHEEDEWDKEVDEWVARYQVYGVTSWAIYPLHDQLTVSARFANDFYKLTDTFNDTTLYSFTVFRFYGGIKWILNPCWFIEGGLGILPYTGFEHSSFHEETSCFFAPQLLFNYNTPKEKALIGFSSDLDLVARDFRTHRAKMVGRWFIVGRYEREIISRGIAGIEGTAYWYDDYVNNTSQRVLGWLQWSPKLADYLLFRYQLQYQRFDEVIPDYYTYKYQITNHLQIQLSKSWCQSFYTSLAYAHGWQATRTRFAQIIVVAPVVTPVNTSFFTQHRQYNLIFLNATYKQDRLELSVRADYYRDTEKYTMWSVFGTLGWRF